MAGRAGRSSPQEDFSSWVAQRCYFQNEYFKFYELEDQSHRNQTRSERPAFDAALQIHCSGWGRICAVGDGRGCRGRTAAEAGGRTGNGVRARRNLAAFQRSWFGGDSAERRNQARIGKFAKAARFGFVVRSPD